MTVLIDIKDLSVAFAVDKRSIHAVKKVSLIINKGESVAVVGESGAGKSQLFHALLGLQVKNATVTGSAKFLGQELLNQSDRVLNTLRGTEINIIFQDPMTSLNPYLTIGKQLSEVLEVHKGLTASTAKEKSIRALLEVKMPQPEKRFTQYPHELSGGMRQRVMIAMSLLTRPQLIIADEPTTALDVTVQTEVISLLKNQHDRYNTSMVLITHDLPVVAGLCDRIVIMYAGQIVEVGTTTEIHHHAKHPYTRALIAATPNNSCQNKTANLISISGQPPNPTDIIEGCDFAPRCTRVGSQCTAKSPIMTKVSSTQSVSCFHWGDIV